MKKTFRFLSGCAIAALMLGGLAACDDKAIDAPDGPGVAERDVTQYMAVTISAPKNSPFSRAIGQQDDFEDGAPNESKVSRLDFFFFNDAGEAAATPCTIEDITPSLDDNYNITTYASVVVEVATAQAANLPTQTICFANLTSAQMNSLRGKSINEVREVAQKEFSNDANFIMSNSVYYGTNIIHPTMTRLCATPITTKLYDTSDEAQAAIDNSETNNILDIYIERLAAKIGLTLNANDIEGYTLVWGDEPTYDGTDGGKGQNLVVLTFNPTYWFMNATAKTEFITKRFGLNTSGNINWFPEYTDVNAAMNNGGMANVWNDPDLFRSYWGCSPSYYSNLESYPNNAAEVDEATPVSYWTYAQVQAEGNKTTIDRQALSAVNGGFSYIAGSHQSATTGTSASGCIYTWETTTAINNIRSSSNPSATVASAVLTGTYSYQTQLNGATTANGEIVAADAASDFYIDTKHGIIKDSDGKDVLRGTFYSSKTSAMKALIAKQQVVYTDENGTDLADADDLDAFTLDHPDVANLASRLVALQYNLNNGQTYYIYDSASGNYVAIDADNINSVNSTLLQLGYFDRYNQGLAMFNIPIRHLGWSDARCLTEDGSYNWGEMLVGDLGVVRNHVYDLKITGIGGLGTGIYDPATPIVPPTPSIRQFIAVKLNVLAWRIVPSQNVPL